MYLALHTSTLSGQQSPTQPNQSPAQKPHCCSIPPSSAKQIAHKSHVLLHYMCTCEHFLLSSLLHLTFCVPRMEIIPTTFHVVKYTLVQKSFIHNPFPLLFGRINIDSDNPLLGRACLCLVARALSHASAGAERAERRADTGHLFRGGGV